MRWLLRQSVAAAQQVCVAVAQPPCQRVAVLLGPADPIAAACQRQAMLVCHGEVLAPENTCRYLVPAKVCFWTALPCNFKGDLRGDLLGVQKQPHTVPLTPVLSLTVVLTTLHTFLGHQWALASSGVLTLANSPAAKPARHCCRRLPKFTRVVLFVLGACDRRNACLAVEQWTDRCCCSSCTARTDCGDYKP